MNRESKLRVPPVAKAACFAAPSGTAGSRALPKTIYEIASGVRALTVTNSRASVVWVRKVTSVALCGAFSIDTIMAPKVLLT